MSLRLKAVLLGGILLITAFAFAENGGQLQPTADVAVAAPLPQAAAQAAPMPMKSETPLGITYGVDGRFRSDNYNNMDATDATNDENRFYRFRTRPFINVNLGKNVDFYWREAQEFYKRTYATCGATAPCHTLLGDPAGASVSDPLSSGDIWVDNAFLNFKKIPGLPGAALKAGRFDLFEGEGFFMFAGIPGAGPKAGGWDAVMFTYARGKQAIDIVATENDRIDNFFPIINQNYTNASSTGNHGPWVNNDMGDLGGILAYYKNRMLKSADLDAYYSFNRQDNMLPPGYSSVTGFTSAEYANLQFQPDRYWHGLGGHAVVRLPYHIIAHGNFTYEAGQQAAMTQTHNNKLLPGLSAVDNINGYPQVSIRAFGMDAFATKYFDFKTKPFVGFMYAYFSGSDPKKPGTDGNFYQAFGEWALTNHPFPFAENGYGIQSPILDLMPNETVHEVGVAPSYFTNYISIYPRVGFTPYQGKVRNLQLIVGYDYVNAPHPFMGNAAHYNPTYIPGANAAGVLNALIPVITSAGAGSVGPEFNQTTLSGLHRWSGFTAEVTSQLSKSFTLYSVYNNVVYGNFFNNTFLTTASTLPTNHALPASRNNAYFARVEIDYRFSGFKSFSSMPKM